MHESDRNRACADQHFGPWAAMPERLNALVSMYRANTLPRVEVDDIGEPYELTPSGVAIINIAGMMMRGRSSFGGTSTVDVRRAVRKAQTDRKVRGILLAVDSPGGTVAGTKELADDVYDARRGPKPIHAFIDSLGASAAIWVASQAERITATAMSEVGSIGTVAVVEDTSGMAERRGIEVHVISTGPHKGAFTPGTEVKPEHLAKLRTRVHDLNEFFLRDLGRGRSMPRGRVDALNTGETWLARKAKVLGLIDAVGSFEQAVAGVVDAMPETRERRRKIKSAIRRKQIEALSVDPPSPTQLKREADARDRSRRIAELEN